METEQTSETVTVLRKARELIARPGGWTQGASARDARGGVVSIAKDTATCFCTLGSLGAAAAVTGFLYWSARDAFRLANEEAMEVGIALWNDAPERTQADVVAAFDKAIEHASRLGLGVEHG